MNGAPSQPQPDAPHDPPRRPIPPLKGGLPPQPPPLKSAAAERPHKPLSPEAQALIDAPPVVQEYEGLERFMRGVHRFRWLSMLLAVPLIVVMGRAPKDSPAPMLGVVAISAWATLSIFSGTIINRRFVKYSLLSAVLAVVLLQPALLMFSKSNYFPGFIWLVLWMLGCGVYLAANAAQAVEEEKRAELFRELQRARRDAIDNPRPKKKN